MSNIEVYKPIKNAFIEAFNSKKVANTPTAELQVKLREIIQLCYQRKGQTVLDSDLGFQSADLTRIIAGEFKQFGIDEIRLCFEKGVLGEYGEYFGLNSATYYKWLKSYTESQERIENANKFKTMKQLPEPEPSHEKILSTMKNAVKRLFSEYQERGYCNDVLNCVYDFLDRNRLIPLDKVQKWEFYNQAAKQIINQKRAELTTSNPMKRTELKNLIQKLEQGQEQGRIIPFAKNLSINHIFSKIENLEELELMLETIEP